MNKQNTFPRPVSLHSNNGFDIARKMNSQRARYIKKPGASLCSKKASRNAIDRKLLVYTVALLVLAGLSFVLKFSFKTLWGAFCAVSLIFFFAGLYTQQNVVNAAIFKDNF